MGMRISMGVSAIGVHISIGISAIGIHISIGISRLLLVVVLPGVLLSCSPSTQPSPPCLPACLPFSLFHHPLAVFACP